MRGAVISDQAATAASDCTGAGLRKFCPLPRGGGVESGGAALLRTPARTERPLTAERTFLREPAFFQVLMKSGTG